MRLEDITDTLFDQKLEEIVKRRFLIDWRTIPDIYSDISEFYNNQVIEELLDDEEL